MIYLALTSAFVAGYLVRSAKAFIQTENDRVERLYRQKYYTRIMSNRYALTHQPSSMVSTAVSTEDFLQLVRNADWQPTLQSPCLN